MFCQSCGNEVKGIAVVCVNCGAPTPLFGKAKADRKPGISTCGLVAAYLFGATFPVVGLVISVCFYVKGHGQSATCLLLFSILSAITWGCILAI